MGFITEEDIIAAAGTRRPYGGQGRGRRCRECGRVFNMLNPEHVEEWYAGHDCES